MADKIPVLITGVGGGGHGHELVKALRLAGGYHLIGVDMSPTSFGLLDVDEAFLVPPANDPRFIETLLSLCKQFGVQVLVTGSEPELRVISTQSEYFIEEGVFPLINTPEVIDIGMDKQKTMSFLEAHSFAHPVFLAVANESDIPLDFPLPAVVKPAVGSGGSKNIYLVQDQAELRFACFILRKRGQIPLLQEYVGTPDDEYTVGILHSMDGEFVGSIALHRHILSGLSSLTKVPNLTGRKELGEVLAISSGVSQGDFKNYPEVRAACEEIATKLGSKGPINIQCRFVNGTLFPFEINPRFSGTSYQRALAGYNEAHLLIRHQLFGDVFPKPIQFQHGTVVRALEERFMPKDQSFPIYRLPES